MHVGFIHEDQEINKKCYVDSLMVNVVDMKLRVKQQGATPKDEDMFAPCQERTMVSEEDTC